MKHWSYIVAVCLAVTSCTSESSAESDADTSIASTSIASDEAAGSSDADVDIASSDDTSSDGEASLDVEASQDADASDATAEGSTATSVGGSAEGATWAIVVAGASSPADPFLEEVAADLGELGFEVSPTNCDQGAAAALAMAPATTYTLSIHFSTESEANEALGKLSESGMEGKLTQIQIACPT